MGLRINTNVASMAAQRALTKNQVRLEHAQMAIATGSRIVKAGDDAAGLSVAENMRGQITGLKAARQNAFNAQSLVQVSDGSLNEINTILIRLRELGVQGASDTVSDVERGFLDKEAQQLIAESDRIAKGTRFGNKALLDGSGGEYEYHVGAYANPDENVIKYTLTADATNSALGIDGASIADKDGSRDILQKVDDALLKLGEMRADFGSVQSRLMITTSNLDVQVENISAARGRINDADLAYETAEMLNASVLNQAAVGVVSQANQNGAIAMKLIG